MMEIWGKIFSRFNLVNYADNFSMDVITASWDIVQRVYESPNRCDFPLYRKIHRPKSLTSGIFSSHPLTTRNNRMAEEELCARPRVQTGPDPVL